MATTLVTRFHEKASELFAYQALIVQVERNYDPGRWISYDRQSRREALARWDLNWSMTDTRLYSKAFTGQALAIPRCPFCLQDDHTSPCCPNNPDQLWLHHQRAVGQAQPTPAPPQGLVAEIRRRYNEGRCRYTRCRFTHACRTCGGQHPLTSYSA